MGTLEEVSRRVHNEPVSLRGAACGLRERSLAMARVLLFAALFVALYPGGFTLLKREAGVQMSNGAQASSIADLFLVQITFTACAVLANALMLIFWREPLSHAGLGGTRRGRDLAIGVVAGAVAMAGLIALLSVFGAVRLSGILLTAKSAAFYASSYCALFAMAAVAEQGVMRAYALFHLSRALGFWPAAIVLALLFGLMHLGNGAESLGGAGVAALFGGVMAYSFKRSGGLWFAVGVQAAWDFMETFVFGVPNSGRVAPGALIQAGLQGPTFLTGGSAGPEGSVLAVAAIIFLALAAHFFLGDDGLQRGSPLTSTENPLAP